MERDICQTILERIGQDFDGECHLTEAEAREAADRIESLRAQLDEARKALELEKGSREAMAAILRAQAERPIGIRPGRRIAPAGREALEKESEE